MMNEVKNTEAVVDNCVGTISSLYWDGGGVT